MITDGELDKYNDAAEKLLEQYEAVDLVSAFLKEIAKDSSSVPVKLTSERPLPFRRGNGGGGNRGNRNFKRGGDRNDRRRRQSNTQNDRRNGGRNDNNSRGNSSDRRRSDNKGGARHEFVIKKK